LPCYVLGSRSAAPSGHLGISICATITPL
jgi:hypothetical protein